MQIIIVCNTFIVAECMTNCKQGTQFKSKMLLVVSKERNIYREGEWKRDIVKKRYRY